MSGNKFDPVANLARLKEMLENIKQLCSIAFIDNELSEYKMNSGNCSGEAIFNEDGISVQNAYFSADSQMEPHAHENVEEIHIVYEGDLTNTMEFANGEVRTLTVQGRGVIIVPPNVNHIIGSKNGCKIIAITIPSDPGYPKTKQDG